MADPQTRKLARQLVQMDERLKHLETVPQMAHSSIDDHGLPVYDKDGNLVTRIGKQADGTWGAPPLAGPTPPAPDGVTAVGGSGIIHVRWTGALYGGVQAPLDFDALEVLIDGDLAGAISDRDGGTVTIQAEQGTRYVSARIRTLVPRHSALTSPFSVEVRAPAEIVLDDMTERADQLEQDLTDSLARVETAEQNLTTLRDVTLPAMRAVLEQADQDAADALQAAVGRIGDAETAITAAEADLSSLRALLDNTDLTDLEQRLAAALADIEHFQTVTMPALDQRLADAELVLAELEDIDIADLTLRLGETETSLAELATTTLPGLEQTITDRITTTETEIRADLDTAAGQLDTARQDLDAALAHQDAQDAALAAAEDRMRVLARQAQRGPVPEPDSPLGAHWVSPSGHLYVRVECEEGVA